MYQQSTSSREDDELIVEAVREEYARRKVIVEVRLVGATLALAPAPGQPRADTPGPRWANLPQFLAARADLEAASIHPFFLLAGDLETLGAPLLLVQAARVGALDRIRHAATLGLFAQKAGGGPIAVDVPRRMPPSMFGVAQKNAVEGCVRESYRALVSAHQAAAAGNSALGRDLGEIAQDKLRHAALAHAIAAWAEPRLSQPERRQIAAEKRAVIAELRAAAAVEQPADVHQLAGLPRSADALAIVDLLEQQFWTDRTRRAK